jgi:hypothetical protein
VVLFFILGDLDFILSEAFLEFCRKIGDFTDDLKSSKTSYFEVFMGVRDFLILLIELDLLTDFTDFLDFVDFAVLVDF